VSSGFDLGLRARVNEHLTTTLTAAYADAHYTQTTYVNGRVLANVGDGVGVLPLVPSPWTTATAVDYVRAFANGATARLQARDVFHSRNPGPFTSHNPDAVIYIPTRTADPATNELNLNASVAWAHLELSLLIGNVFNSQPTLQRRNHGGSNTLFYATTFRPRSVGFAVSWALDGSPP